MCNKYLVKRIKINCKNQNWNWMELEQLELKLKIRGQLKNKQHSEDSPLHILLLKIPHTMVSLFTSITLSYL